ncbi:MAG: ChbG/HpnK family deacetylase, partial [Bacteroidota bacterium]
WTMKDLEKELRAQIEMAKRDIRNLSHITTHMGFQSAAPEIGELVESLSKEYDLHIDFDSIELSRFRFKRDKSADFLTQEEAFARAIKELDPGTYLFVEHPALDTQEMETIGHRGYSGVGYDREGVTRIFTSEIVKQAIKDKNIRLISYQDLKR